MEVKRAIEEVKSSKTLKQVLSTLLSIGNFLNGTKVAPPPSSLVLYIYSPFLPTSWKPSTWST